MSADTDNARFWSYICGSGRQQQLGEQYEAWYWNRYPWLEKWIPFDDMTESRVLEVGIGSGVTAGRLARTTPDFHALDVALEPLEALAARYPNRVTCTLGSILDAPFGDGEFDHVVAIGCVHHTGDTAGAIAEIGRISRGGCTIMVYQKDSGKPERPELWDTDHDGNGPPFTSWWTVGEVEDMLRAAGFDQVTAGVENYRAPRGVNVYACAYK